MCLCVCMKGSTSCFYYGCTCVRLRMRIGNVPIKRMWRRRQRWRPSCIVAIYEFTIVYVYIRVRVFTSKASEALCSGVQCTQIDRPTVYLCVCVVRKWRRCKALYSGGERVVDGRGMNGVNGEQRASSVTVVEAVGSSSSKTSSSRAANRRVP